MIPPFLFLLHYSLWMNQWQPVHSVCWVVFWLWIMTAAAANFGQEMSALLKEEGKWIKIQRIKAAHMLTRGSSDKCWWNKLFVLQSWDQLVKPRLAEQVGPEGGTVPQISPLLPGGVEGNNVCQSLKVLKRVFSATSSHSPNWESVFSICQWGTEFSSYIFDEILNNCVQTSYRFVLKRQRCAHCMNIYGRNKVCHPWNTCYKWSH